MTRAEANASGAPGTEAGSIPFWRLFFVAMSGAAIEWYDFFIFATASALVFGPLFFPEQVPLVGTLLAFSTFATGFVARPLGGIVFGYFGDKVGRKRAVVVALVLMGAATTLIGLLPTAATIGVLAPLLLVTLRIAQGLALGGQAGGLVLIATENAPRNRRGFYGSLAMAGVPVGLILANGGFLLVAALLPQEQFQAWGWRVPFLLSVFLIGVALYVQFRLEETRSFQKVETSHAEARNPLISAIRNYPKEVLLTAGTVLGPQTIWYLLFVYTLSYGTDVLGLTNNTILASVLVSQVLSAVLLVGFGRLSDNVGRRKVFMSGMVLTILWAFPFFLLLDTALLALVLVALLVGQLFVSMTMGPLMTMISEQFGTRVRYSGVSLGYQLAAVLSGFAPLISTALFAATGTSLWLSVYVVLVGVVSFVATVLIAETYQGDMDEIGPRERRFASESE
jgi:MFS transporter, MHS family, shikimate and dehydroshikimate transport protein